MKKLKKSIAFILTAVMALTVFTIPTFAAVGDEDVQADQQVVLDEQQDQVLDQDEQALPEEGEMDVQSAQPAAPKLATYQGYMSVILEWDAVPGADKYIIERSKKKITKVALNPKNDVIEPEPYTEVAEVTPGNWSSEKMEGVYNEWHKWQKATAENTLNDEGMTPGVERYQYQDGTVNALTDYNYRVIAVDSSGVKSEPSNVSMNRQVQGMEIRFQVKKTHDYRLNALGKKGKKAKQKLKPGEVYRGYGYSSGYYHMLVPEGYEGYGNKQAWVAKGCTVTKTRQEINAEATTESPRIYTYSDKVRERCVNDKGRTSDSKYLIWANLYTLEVTVFEGKKDGNTYKNWKVAEKDGSTDFFKWDCTCGHVSTPTFSGDFSIKNKLYLRHKLHFWNCYCGLQALHQRKFKAKKNCNGDDKNMGVRPSSNGCIRNPVDKVWWIYNGQTGTVTETATTITVKKDAKGNTSKGVPLKTSVWVY